MVNVAIAGGTGGVGRSIVEAFKGDSRHSAIVLSRKVGIWCRNALEFSPDLQEQKQSQSEEDVGLPIVEVNYESVDALIEALEKHRIHTVVSTLGLHIIGVGVAQVNLIKAADRSSFTKRFVASNWAVRASDENMKLHPHGYQHLASYAELDKSGLEWTAFNVGWFLEYYGMLHVKTYNPQTTFVVDMANKAAAIPGTGKDLMTFTYSLDVAKFVLEAIDLPNWDRDTIVVGEKITWEEFVKLAESARGDKFTVTYDSVEKLEKGEITELPGQVAAYSYFYKEWQQKLFSVFGLWVTRGVFDLPEERALNKKFPNIKLMSVKEMLHQAWEGK